jgi:hypothetical protein
VPTVIAFRLLTRLQSETGRNVVLR